jgi:hypothetical protein
MKMFSVDVVLITTAYVEAPSREAAIANLTKVVGKPYASKALPKFENGAEVLLQRDDRRKQCLAFTHSAQFGLSRQRPDRGLIPAARLRSPRAC